MSQKKSSPEQIAFEQGMQAAANEEASDVNPYDARTQNDLWLAWRQAYEAKLLSDKLCQ